MERIVMLPGDEPVNEQQLMAARNLGESAQTVMENSTTTVDDIYRPDKVESIWGSVHGSAPQPSPEELEARRQEDARQQRLERNQAVMARLAAGEAIDPRTINPKELSPEIRAIVGQVARHGGFRAEY